MPSPLLFHVFPSFGVGGAQARFAALANHFASEYRHAILAMDGDTSCRERLDPGLDVTFPPISVRKGGPFANVRVFRRALRQLAPAALVTSNWGSIEWAIANAKPIARHVHMEDGFGPEERAGQIRRRVWTRGAVLRRSTVLLPSRTLAAIASDVWRLPRSAARYVPNGIDLAVFTPRARRRPGPAPVIGTVAGLRTEKNIGRLVGAVAQVAAQRPVRLVIVGDGPQRGALETLATERGIGSLVTFAGHEPRPSSAYAGFDIFALSSDTEQMPLSVLEAMACGLPVASTDVGDVRRMVAPENADFVVPQSEDALAKVLFGLLEDPDRAMAAGRANRLKAEVEYSDASMFDAHRAAWDGEPAE